MIDWGWRGEERKGWISKEQKKKTFEINVYIYMFIRVHVNGFTSVYIFQNKCSLYAMIISQ